MYNRKHDYIKMGPEMKTSAVGSKTYLSISCVFKDRLLKEH